MSEINPAKLNRKRFEYDLSATGRFPVNNFKESPEHTITVKHIPGIVTRQAIIDFASQFGTLAVEPHITQSSQKLQKLAFLTFIEQSAVSRCMNGNRQNYTIDGHSVIVQRWLPIGLVFDRTSRVLLFLDADNSNESLTEDEICNYFHTHYGQTKGFFWSSDTVATIDFEDYDAIDRAVLDCVTHTINGVKVRIEKVRSSTIRNAYEQIIAPHDMKFCVHVTNIPPHVTGEQLANIFDSQVWNVLIRRGIHPDTDPFEAWILNITTISVAESLAASVNSIDDVKVQCKAEIETLNEWTLCNGNRDGWCKHGDDCIYRHVTCTSGDACIKEECLFSHTKSRKTKPNPRNRPPGPIEQHYRIRIDGFPYTMSATELLTELKKQPLHLLKFIEIPQVPEDSKTRYLYLTRQAAEKLARKRIFEWHDYPIREDYIIKCQLEYDRMSVTDVSSNNPSSPLTTTLQTDNQRLRTLFAPLIPGSEEIDGMPSEWVWTNRRLGGQTSKVYLVYPSNSADDRLGAMKIYHSQNEIDRLCAKRELFALRTLQNEMSVVSIYQSNIFNIKRKKNTPIWMIASMSSEFTLKDYIEQNKSTMTFHQILLLTRQLLDIIQRCHQAHVLHRNLQPKNILVKKNNEPTSTDEIKLVLINFKLAWTDNNELPITDQEDLRIMQNFLNESSDHIFCTLQHLLLSASSVDQRCSPTIDATGICYIFFWLLTDQWPDRIPLADTPPHRESKCNQKIKDKLGDIQLATKLYDEIMLIFDHTFAVVDQWWSIHELLDHLNNLQASFIEFERAELITLFPITAVPTFQPLNDQYARIIALIAHVKQQFAEQHSTCIQWSKGSNKWSTKNKDIEVRNTDELVYNYQEKQCTVTIILFAKIDSNPATLFLGSGDQNETVEFKFLCSLAKETTDTDVSAYFDIALKKIIREKLRETNSSC